jgi:hypothetical protein
MLPSQSLSSWSIHPLFSREKNEGLLVKAEVQLAKGRKLQWLKQLLVV